MRSLRSLPVIVGIAVWASSGQAPAQAADSIIGTWTLNVAKPTYSPGPPPMGGMVVRTYTRRLAADGKTTTITITGTDDQGRTISNTVVLERQ